MAQIGFLWDLRWCILKFDIPDARNPKRKTWIAENCLNGFLVDRLEMITHYHINIFYSEEDGGYIADIPDLESCSAFGPTAEKALAEVEVAKKAWVEAAKKAGKPIPQPRYRPVIYQVAE